MAIFPDQDKHDLCLKIVADIKTKEGVTDIPLTRPQIWALVQAVRDVLDSAAFRTTVSDAMDAATSPLTLSVAAKKRVLGRVFEKLFAGEVA